MSGGIVKIKQGETNITIEEILKTSAVESPIEKTAPVTVEISAKKSVALKMERNIPFIMPVFTHNVIVVGCGGTGSHVIPHLMRLIAASAQRASYKVTFLDGDVVESKNLIRQHFIESDINKNKAEVLASRYSAAFGIPVVFKDKYVEDVYEFNTLISGHTLIISCVDNVKTRQMIKTAVDMSVYNIAWIDCGNEDMTGQVVLSAHIPSWDVRTIATSGKFPIPDVFQLYPDLYTKLAKDKFASELSCAELAVSSPQHGFVNLTAATLALNFIYGILTIQPIYTHAVEFNIKNKYAHRPLNTTTIGSWAHKCDHWSKFSPEQIA